MTGQAAISLQGLLNHSLTGWSLGYIHIRFIYSACFHDMAFIYCYTWFKKSYLKVLAMFNKVLTNWCLTPVTTTSDGLTHG